MDIPSAGRYPISWRMNLGVQGLRSEALYFKPTLSLQVRYSVVVTAAHTKAGPTL